MKSRYTTLLVIVAATAVLSQKPSYADDRQGGGIPLVVGQFSFSAQGNVGICLNPGTSTVESCGASGVVVISTIGTDNGAVTWDDAGNSCASYTNVQSALPLGGSPPAVTATAHLVTKLADYDSTTGTGNNLFTTYIGGTCNGATFDSRGATVFSTGSEHFVVSDGGNRLDFVLTTLTNSTHSIGGFSFTGTELKQTSPQRFQ